MGAITSVANASCSSSLKLVKVLEEILSRGKKADSHSVFLQRK